uniref:Methionine synthase reductase n=1 Tax=Acrobeloides nanus TaxID=290746 RepID=A0A914D012_9BILA
YNLQEETLIVIVISSTGDGDPPDNAHKFMKKIHDKSLDTNFLSNTQFALLGLGDSNYSTFQGVPKKLEKRLLQLGAKKFIESGGADDQIGLELAVEPWLDCLYNALRLRFHLKLVEDEFQSVIPKSINISHLNMADQSNQQESKTNADETRNKMIPFLDIEPLKFPDDEPSLVRGSDSIRNQENLRVPISAQNFLVSSVTHELFDSSSCQWQNGERFPGMHGEPIEAKVVGTLEISAEGIAHKPKREIHLELDRDEKSEKILNEYDAGDSFYFIFPNPKREVEFILDRLKLSVVADQKCHLSVDSNTAKRNAAVPKYIPNPCSLRYIFTYCLDIRRAPGRPLLRVLVEHTTNETEKRRLLELCSAEGVQEFTSY